MQVRERGRSASRSRPVNDACTSTPITSEPNSTKNAKTVTISSSIWTTWTTRSTRIRFQRSKPVTSAYDAGSASGSATRRAQASSSGVPAAGAEQEGVVDGVVDLVDLLGQPHQQEHHREHREAAARSATAPRLELGGSSARPRR